MLSLELPQWHRVTALCASPVWPQWYLCFPGARGTIVKSIKEKFLCLASVFGSV